jgi:hypothetical protein
MDIVLKRRLFNLYTHVAAGGGRLEGGPCMHRGKLHIICRGVVGGGISRTSPASAPEHNKEDSKGAEEGEDRPNRTRNMPQIGTSMVSILKFPNHVPVAADIVADDIVCNLVGPVSDPSGRWFVIAILLVDNE